MYKSIYSGLIMDECTTLSTVTESDKTGLRLLKSNPETHGDIGEDAIDLSTQTLNSTTTGAIGDYSFAIGKNTTANGIASLAIGVSNFGLNDTIFEIGIGDNITPKNALEVYQDGKIIAPSLDEIIDDKSLVTKEYVDALGFGGGVVEEENLAVFTPNFIEGNYFEYTLNQDTTIANPLNYEKGQTGKIVVRQNDVGGYTLSFSDFYQFPISNPIIKDDSEAINIFDYTVIDIENIYVEFSASYTLGNDLAVGDNDIMAVGTNDSLSIGEQELQLD